MVKKYFGFRIIPLIFFCTVSLGVILHLKTNIGSIFHPRSRHDDLYQSVKNYMQREKKKTFAEQSCKMPILDVMEPDILAFVRRESPSLCNNTKDWVEVDGSVAKITQWAKETFGNIECTFTDILRGNEDQLYDGNKTKSHSEYILEASDVVRVKCKTDSGARWKKVLLGIRSDPEILKRSGWSKVSEDSLKLNVLMLGFASLSHNMWKRLLPKSYRYATKNLLGVALNGYNVVGNGGAQALIPILTGRTVLELPEVRMVSEAQNSDLHPYIWKNFRNNGYVTLYGEDMPSKGPFQRDKGFNSQPVDHYPRAFYMETEPSYQKDMFCYHGTSKFEVMKNYIQNMFKVYKDKPKFVFSFFNEYTHENIGYVSKVDDALHKFLQDLNFGGYFNNTMLVLLSDHGSRFPDYRSTQVRKLEERLPGCIFVLPSWFRKKYPEEYSNFKANGNSLTTAFDVHKTLKNVLHFEGNGRGDIQKRGISLFKQIPLARLCKNSGIEPQWCACLDWERIPVNRHMVSEAVNYAIEFMNNDVKQFRHVCAKLRLQTIVWAALLVPNDDVLKFKVSEDEEFSGEMTDNTSVSVETYFIRLVLSPGNMEIIATLRYILQDHRFILYREHIIRIDESKSSSFCLDNKLSLQKIREYCYCL